MEASKFKKASAFTKVTADKTADKSSLNNGGLVSLSLPAASRAYK
jgi:hypothetical protein